MGEARAIFEETKQTVNTFVRELSRASAQLEATAAWGGLNQPSIMKIIQDALKGGDPEYLEQARAVARQRIDDALAEIGTAMDTFEWKIDKLITEETDRVIDDLELGDVELPSPVNKVAAPTRQLHPAKVVIPSKPYINFPREPGSPPTLNFPVVAQPTERALPDVPPDPGGLAIPVAPTIVIDPWTLTDPVFNLATPTLLFNWQPTDYNSTLLTALTTKVYGDLQNGGYGIEQADQDAVFNRLRDQIARSQQTELKTLRRAWARSGFPIPPGALHAGEKDILHRGVTEQNAGAREIALKLADMYVENRRFTIQEARTVETALMDYLKALNQFSLDAAKFVVQVAIEDFNNQRERLFAELKHFDSVVAGRRNRIEEAKLQIEVYLGQLRGVELEAGIRELAFKIYAVQVDAVKTAYEVDRIQAEIAQIYSRNEALRIEAYKQQVEAFSAKVRANAGLIDVWKTEMDAERMKLQIDEQDAKNLAIEVDIAKAKMEINVGVNEAENKRAAVQIETKKLELAAKTHDLDARVAKLKSLAEMHRIKGGAASDEVNAVIKSLDLLLEYNRTLTDHASRKQTIDLDGAKVIAQGYVKDAEIRASATEGLFRGYASATVGVAGRSTATSTTEEIG